MKKAVPDDHELIPDELKDIPIWFGGSLNEQTIWNTMKIATKPFSNGTSTSQRERSLHKGNVPFSNGTFASQMERSLFKGNVFHFSKCELKHGRSSRFSGVMSCVSRTRHVGFTEALAGRCPEQSFVFFVVIL